MCTTINQLNFFEDNKEESIQKISFIGKPISGSKVYIVDENDQLCPIGVPGELLVNSDRLSRGYYGQAKLTAQKFIPHLFEKHGKLYRTGDIVRWVDDGILEFVARKDNLLKIRGFRVDLSEVSEVLLKHSSIEQCIVLPEEDIYVGKTFVAYLKFKPRIRDTLGTKTLKQFMLQFLLPHMIPHHFMRINHIPLTLNGKIDQQALRNNAMPLQQANQKNEKKLTGMESGLTSIWKELLRNDGFNAEDNIFDYGAHSLLLPLACAKAKRQLGLPISIIDFLNYPTPKSLAKQYGGQRKYFSNEEFIGMVDARTIRREAYA
jgi:hypothetical protein